MFDMWEHDVEKDTAESDNEIVECKVSPGTLTYIGVFFPPGCFGYAKCRVTIGEKHVFPRSPGNFITGSGFMVEARNLNENITENIPVLKWHMWNSDPTYYHTLWLLASWIPEEEAYDKQTATTIKDLVSIFRRIIGV